VFVVRTQRNAWIHAIASAIVVFLCFWLRLPARDWALIVLAIGMVWTSEFLNTALEAWSTSPALSSTTWRGRQGCRGSGGLDCCSQLGYHRLSDHGTAALAAPAPVVRLAVSGNIG